MRSLNETVFHIKDEIELHGRIYFEDGALCLPWSEAGLTVRFVGESIAFDFLDYKTQYADYDTVVMRLEIDGAARKCCISSGKEVVFCDGLDDTEHTVTLTKVSESMEPIRANGIQILGKEPRILPAAKKDYKFKMEVVGDSITCAYGALGVGDKFNPFEEDSTLSYASVAAREMNAELRLISISGRGLAKNCDGTALGLFGEFFVARSRATGSLPHSFESWQPDVLVINGGTNDYNSSQVSDEEFYSAVEKFYNLVRRVYPHAKILFFYGAMGTGYLHVYEKLVEKLQKNDTDVYLYPVQVINASIGEHGANGHPSAIAHQRIAKELVAAIESIM